MSDGEWALINVAAGAIPAMFSLLGLWWASRYNRRAEQEQRARFDAEWNRARSRS